MIFVNNRTREKRMDICKACEHYKPDTRTCGTFRGINPKGDKVKKGKGYVTLCGCVMPVKSSFKTFGCPLGKWKREVDKKALQELNELLAPAEKTGRMAKEEAEQLIDVFNKHFKTNHKYSSCGSCMRTIVKEIRQAIKEGE